MKIKKLAISSPSALNFGLDTVSPICVLHGEHSALALDLIRELIQDYDSETDPDSCDDGHFVIHSDMELDGKNYSVCYIRNADFMGDNRIAVNFVPNSLDFSRDDTKEFIEKCVSLSKDTSNVIYNYKAFSVAEDHRPLFVYCRDAEDITSVIEVVSALNRQAFIAVNSDEAVIYKDNVQLVSMGGII